MVGLDDADVVTMDVLSKVVELLEHALHSAVASDQAVMEQMLVYPRVGEVAAKRLVVQRVVAQTGRVSVQVRISQVEVKVLLRPPHLYTTRSSDDSPRPDSV